MTVRLNALQERILLELSGRGQKVSVRDLCDTIGMDPSDWERADTDLILGKMISYHANFAEYENPSYAITWIGEEWLAKRPARGTEPRSKRRWFGLARRAAGGLR